MKKPYISPTIEMESFMLNQQIASCPGVKIGLTDMACVLTDPDAPPAMKNLAMAGYFFDGCSWTAEGGSFEDGICYHTSINLAFTS